MKLLLDTHVILWMRADAPELPKRFRDAIAHPSKQELASAISLAEVAVKRAVGKLAIDDDFGSGLAAVGLDELAFTSAHAAVLDQLPLLHRDPFDRMLIAQAISEKATFLTVDGQCFRNPVKTMNPND